MLLLKEQSSSKLEIFIRFLLSLSIFFGISGGFFQLWKMIYTKKTDHVSMMAIITLTIGISIQQIYAVYFGLWEMLIPNIIALCIFFGQIFFKCKYDTQEQQFKLDENLIDIHISSENIL